MNIQVKAHFNKQTKDSKKELVQFYLTGDDERKPELNVMTRNVVELSIEGVEQTLTAEFVKSSKDSKKTVLDFVVKGDASSDNSYEFYKLAGSDVVLTIAESQMSIDEFREEQEEYREGLKGKINEDGTVELEEDPNQLSIDDEELDGEGEHDDSDGPVIPSDDDLPF